MRPEFSSVYDDGARADADAKLEFPATYYLAYRDLPAILQEHVRGGTALDFGCGTGRSTRFLGRLGFDVTGVDIAAPMLAQARKLDPEGEYLVSEGDRPLGLPSATARRIPLTPEGGRAMAGWSTIPKWHCDPG